MKTIEEHHQTKLERLNTFVDAVLAIVITLLVLNLRLPVLTEINSTKEMMQKLSTLLPHFHAFLLCFLSVIVFWHGNNSFFSVVVKYDNTLALLSALGLLSYSLLPFSASIIGEYPNNPGSFVFFGGLYFYNSVMAVFQLQHCWRKKAFSKTLNLNLYEKRVLKLSWLSPIIVLLIIGSAFISTTLSLILFSSMLLLWLYLINQLKLSTKNEN